jgi:hypothetical protein
MSNGWIKLHRKIQDNPFGGDWTNYYMITQLNRLPNKVNIVAREVG